MPIRVTCPSCGRVGQGPDRAVGRTVRCPACSHMHTLTADMVLPEGPPLRDEAPPPLPAREPRVRSQSESEPAPKPKARPGAGSAGEIYDVEEAAAEPPKRPIKPRPAVTADDEPHDRDRPAGLHLPIPLLVGGAVGVALVSILSAWAVLSMSRREPAVASASPPKPVAVQAAAAPAPALAPAPAPAVADTKVTAPKADSPPQAPATQVAVATAPAPVAATAPAPVPAAPAEVSVIDLLRAPDAPAEEKEPAGESDVAAQARAGAAAVATRDDGAGKTLSTADIVAESEPSVALIKGTSSSGTGFLVAPGLVATNAHVIEDEFISDLEVRFVSADESHNAPLKAELLYDDRDRDLAFLAVKTDLKPLRVAKTYAFRKGEDITVIGNPGLGDGQVLENAISRGVMSTKTQIDNRSFYQLGIAINPGNSGGPVFDSSGRVIGVATLKASKQEATGFSIPIEDFQAALTKVAQATSGDADRYRSRHRINNAVKSLGGAGALMCLIIDLRRADAVSNSPQVKELLGKLESVVAEFDKEIFPTLVKQAARIKNDALVVPANKRMVGEMTENFQRIHAAYASRKNVDDKLLRPWKQTHRRLITDLSAALKLEVPAGMMVAFDDHIPSQPTVITLGPQNLGAYGSRLRQRSLNGAQGGSRTPGGITRSPSLRDRRMQRRNGR